MKPSISKILKSLNVFNNVRKFIAILVTCVFCYLSIIGKVSSDQFIPIFAMIIGYYFGKSTALDIPKPNNNKK